MADRASPWRWAFFMIYRSPGVLALLFWRVPSRDPRLPTGSTGRVRAW
jgi:hypothetical protein